MKNDAVHKPLAFLPTKHKKNSIAKNSSKWNSS